MDGDITANVVKGGTFVNTNTVGTFTITYDVTDAAGNAATTVTRTIHVTDQTAPVITLTGASAVTVAQGSTFTDPGVTATDNVDGDITANVVKGGTFVNTNTVGTFTITYDVTDAAGNAATTVTRTVNVTAASTSGGTTGSDASAGTGSGGGGGCLAPAQTAAQGFGLATMLLTMLSGLGLVRRRKDK